MKMFLLIDGAEYKLFDAKMFSLTDGARNKLFGTKMFTPSPLRRWGFYIGDSQCLFLKVTSIISVTHFFNLHPKNSAIFWMIPVSSRYAKFQCIYEKQVKKYGRCTKIVLGKCGGKDAAFLIQNAFPVTADYFDHIHTSQGKPLTLQA